jgi:hypothetical protein
VESKRGRIPRVKYWEAALAILAALSASIALADDFKTTNGKEYKNAKISRVEPDCIVIAFSGGIVKIPFTELSKELQEKYHYDPEAAQKFAAQSAEQIKAANAAAAELKAKTDAERAERNAASTADYQNRQAEKQAEQQLAQIRIFAVIEPFIFHEEQTVAHIQPYERYDTGERQNESASSLNYVPVYDWRKVGDKFTGVIDEHMSERYESGDEAVVTLYKIGHTNDSDRDPLFTTKKEKAVRFLTTGSTK